MADKLSKCKIPYCVLTDEVVTGHWQLQGDNIQGIADLVTMRWVSKPAEPITTRYDWQRHQYLPLPDARESKQRYGEELEEFNSKLKSGEYKRMDMVVWKADKPFSGKFTFQDCHYGVEGGYYFCKSVSTGRKFDLTSQGFSDVILNCDITQGEFEATFHAVKRGTKVKCEVWTG